MWTNLNRIVEPTSSISSSSVKPLDDKAIPRPIPSTSTTVVPDRKSEEEIEISIPYSGSGPPSQIPDSLHRETPPEQRMTGVHDVHGAILPMPWGQSGSQWTVTDPSSLFPPMSLEPLPRASQGDRNITFIEDLHCTSWTNSDTRQAFPDVAS